MRNLSQNISREREHLRDPSIVMDLKRLGSFYPYKLSFMRKIIRKITREQWNINLSVFNLDKDGFGEAIYEIETPENNYHFVVFADFLDPNLRTDRVIAEAWDMTVTLRHGAFNQSELETLRQNVPLQEKGRMPSDCIVLSRANKSSRNFKYVIDRLRSGKQPSIKKINEVGYLYRTTAVYGSGKFGMADWEKVSLQYREFSEPFSAEMFSCFLIRQFSLDQADHIASKCAPEAAVKLDDNIKRFIGIGNATGLGMAPFLIKHPLLINNWIEKREFALAEIFSSTKPDNKKINEFSLLLKRASTHLKEISTENNAQKKINKDASNDINSITQWLKKERTKIKDWQQLIKYVTDNYSIETQEIINAIIIEVHPKEALAIERNEIIDEKYELIPEMSLTDLKNIIESKYKWALNYDFNLKDTDTVFWYRSEEKMEPRLGTRNIDHGEEKEILIGIARAVQQCYSTMNSLTPEEKINTVAEFVFDYPVHRQIIRRMQTMSKTTYGEIQANLLDKDVLPIHLLRCKLSFFGVGKFDPKSRLWVRNTMFQGAPIIKDIDKECVDDWFFPIMPNKNSSKGNEVH